MEKINESLNYVQNFWSTADQKTKIGIIAGVSATSLIILRTISNRRKNAFRKINDLPTKQKNGEAWPRTITAVTNVAFDKENIKNAIKIDSKFAFPKPNPNQLLIKVYSASLNPIDWKIATGFLSKVVTIPFS